MVAYAIVLFLYPISVDQPLYYSDLSNWAYRWGLLQFFWFLALDAYSARATNAFSMKRLITYIKRYTIFCLIFIIFSFLCGFTLAVVQYLGLYGTEWQLQSRAGYSMRLGTTTSLYFFGLPASFIFFLTELYQRTKI